MTTTKDPSQAEHKEALEFVIGSVVIIVFVLVVLSFLHSNLLSSVTLDTLGILIGGLYSRHKLKAWSSFASQKVLDDSKHPTTIQRFASVGYMLLLLLALNLIGNYVNIKFEIITGINEIMVSFYLGYLVWLLWLHNRSDKKESDTQ